MCYFHLRSVSKKIWLGQQIQLPVKPLLSDKNMTSVLAISSANLSNVTPFAALAGKLGRLA